MNKSVKIANMLIHEKSPYLLQHAHNPVYWYPWGQEAFEKAQKDNKPIFLSIGYSTCHWCHVMEEESFEDQEVADLLNKHFISIKVDKEERPDIDAIYMSTCQALTGGGGWPLTIIMTPDQKPFFAGTYFPKNSRYGINGFLDILKTVANKWKNTNNEIIKISEDITNAIKEQYNTTTTKGEPSKKLLHTAFSLFESSFDEDYGGFGNAPKFPSPHNLMFLLRYYNQYKNDKALYMVERTLEQMYRGGIFDHIGYGFSRYSTDRKWLVPHFEKMLYDNALLTIVYLETYQITKKELYKNIAQKTMKYILGEMTDSLGGFYCAQDADSDKEEGKYYTFTPDEIIKVLGEQDGRYFNDYFNITKNGNFEGKNIANLLSNPNYDKTDEIIHELTQKVYNWRKTRVRLHKDDKILTSWNSLMIIAFAKAYKILDDEKYIIAAKKASQFIENNLVNDGQLSVHYRDGKRTGNGTVDDYAFYTWALIELYQSTFEIDYLKKALSWNEKMLENFYDSKNGGFYMTSKAGEELIIRPKETYDGAIPSGNSVAAYNLIKLAKLTGNYKLEEKANEQFKFMVGVISNYPSGYSFFMMSLLFALSNSKEVVCLVKDKYEFSNVKKLLNQYFLPSTTFIVKNDEVEEELENLIPFVADYKLKDNESAFYVCNNNTCTPPVSTANELINLLLKN